jgi:hypothetical protein
MLAHMGMVIPDTTTSIWKSSLNKCPIESRAKMIIVRVVIGFIAFLSFL